MPHLFTCPHCQTKTEVEDRYSGQTGQCVTCGGAIQLPTFGEQAKAAAATKRDGSLRWIIASVVAVILVGCLVFAAVRIGGKTMTRLTTNRERTSSIQNLEKIAKALNAYAADHGSYPPPATRDAKKKKMHSWRVLILPYLGEEELYGKFDLNRSWDDAANMSLASEMPAVYRHPNSSQNGMYLESGYYLIVGPGTLFPPLGPLGPIISNGDNPAQTILVAEGTPLVPSKMWTEPIDLDYGKMNGNIGGNPGIEVGGLLDGGVAMATMDGRGHFVPDTMAADRLLSLVTPAGNERLPDDTLD